MNELMETTNQPVAQNNNSEIQVRAIQEVQAQVIMAKKFPRDLNSVYANVMTICKRKKVAEQAQYNFPRGGTNVKGPSIRLTEAIAQQYGNMDYGVRELERHEGFSVAESYCWDLEKNLRVTKRFEVPHVIGLKGGRSKVLSDPRDIYEHVANQGARRMRACILGVIPSDLVEDAISACTKTLIEGGGETLQQRLQKMAAAFKDIGVSVEMLEERLKHKLDLTTAEEIVDLIAVYNSIRDNHTKRSDFFNFKGEQEEPEGKAIDLIKDLEKEKDV